MNQLEHYYSNYNEDGRLLTRHGHIEYLTTMKYIHEYLERLEEKQGKKTENYVYWKSVPVPDVIH